MKKRTKIWLIIASVLVVVGGLIFTYALSKAGYDFREIMGEDMEISNYNIGDSFDNIYIDTQTTDIDFFTWREPEVKVECTKTRGIKYDVRVEDSTLKIETSDERKWYDYIKFFSLDMKLRVYLPGEVDYSSVVVRNTTGDVIIPEQISADTLDVDITTGDIKCYAKVNESVKLKTTTGDIDLKSTDCQGDIELKSSSGDTAITDVNCQSLICSGTTGDIIMKNVVADAKLTLKRTTGDIGFERVDASELFIKTTTGDVTGTLLSDKSFVTKTTTGDVNVPDTTGGKCEISVTTGDIKIGIE